jgi:hypothetical protein
MKNLLLILLISNLYAQDNVCDLNEVQLEKKVSLGSKEPEYFFKPVPKHDKKDDRDEVSIIIGGGNYYLDMNDGKTKRIPGPYDGVPTPDGEFIVSPALGDHITFYDREDLKNSSDPVFNDVDDPENGALYGVYHSLGVLDKKVEDNGDKIIKYRAITDTVTPDNLNENTLRYKDYTFRITADGEKEFIESEGSPKLICSNMADQTLKTPILAKNGRMLSAYSPQTGTTIIYDVVKDSNGDSVCNVKKDLGFATSKMEFSPDGDKVVFAMNSMQTVPSEVDWYSEPPVDTHNMNVFVYDMNSDDLTKMTSKKIGNSYYPSFSNDGETVVWLSQEVDEDWDTQYYVERANINDGQSMKLINMQEVKSCDTKEPFSFENLAIGKLWDAICSPLDTAMTTSALMTVPLSMDPKNCEKLVKANWIDFKDNTDPSVKKLIFDEGYATKPLNDDEQKFYMDQFLALDEEDLIKTCQNLNSAEAVIKVDDVNMDEIQEVEVDPFLYCTQCHSNPEADNYIPFREPEKMGPWKKKALLHVMTGNMPKNMPISDETRERIVEKLRTLPDN